MKFIINFLDAIQKTIFKLIDEGYFWIIILGIVFIMLIIVRM